MRIGILTPMPSELRPVTRALSLRRSRLGDLDVQTGEVNGVEVVATLTGVGVDAATRATERLLAAAPVDHVVVAGIAGGIDPAVAIGDVVVPEVVVDESTGNEYRPAPLGDEPPAAAGKLFTVADFSADPEVIAGLAARGATAVDMETAAVAAVCEAGGRPWSVFRGISDHTAENVVDEAVFRLLNPDGSPNLRAVARYLALRPWRVALLARIARDAGKAATGAARACAHALR